MGSTVSIAVGLLMTGLVFLLLPGYADRLAEEKGSLWVACLISIVLATSAATSFYGELKQRAWKYAAHAALALLLGATLWVYWPKT